MELALKFIVFLPLLSSIFNGLFHNKFNSLMSSGAILISAFLAFLLFIHSGIERNVLYVVLADWIIVDSLNISWALYVDQLTAIMFFLVTSVSAVVHIYSLGYMHNDKNLPKFLSYLSLFTFFMLSLVSADNFVQLFFGWEGVGLCSYLLIGYYYTKDSANAAAIKAFIVNRVGDFAFIIAIVMIIAYTESADFEHVFAMSANLSNIKLNILGNEFVVLDVICLLMFFGCMGKSAQIGMHVWLPDAMEGPTPVSALIHAATMVTAGVFLIARCSFMFEYSPCALQVIAIIGAITCLFAALVAIAQTDIKKIIAYSTCSQLGYMFFACGVSAYQIGIFHLVTHGFFKALLFLSAGNVIHACLEQDIFKIGNLRKKMPITYANFWIGSLSIIGIFPFAGFYSKDLILESAYLAGGVGSFAFALGIVAAILTAIYSIKIIILTFHGSTRLTKEAFNHAHEAPNVMNVPLLFLTMGALFSGMIGYYILGINNPYGFFNGSIFHANVISHESHAPVIIESLPLVVGIVGILFGIYIYKTNKYIAVSRSARIFYYILKNKFFFDEVYNQLFVGSVRRLSCLFNLCDIRIIDRFGPNGFAITVRLFSRYVSKLQTGYIFNYAFYIIFAITICITFFVVQYFQISGI